ncbi:hypothetical protein E4T47_01824 [Aureobasidium subglaciale]|nr:hypothetical protein E4T47_01824 [Aureobasidium subglaciale]
MSPPRRALISITSASASLFNGQETTGLFISEALHPYNTGSPNNPTSSRAPTSPPGTIRPQTSARNWTTCPKHLEIVGSKYGVFYASAGHASLIDYPTATSLQKIAEQVWANGGIVASVCHGPAIFANVIDRATNEPIIKGKRLTGFTTEAEKDMGIFEELKSWDAEMVEELAERLGATYERGAGVWDDFYVVDGRLVTGQNPQSAASTTKAVVEAFEKL